MSFSTNYNDKTLEKLSPVFFEYKFWQDKLSDFSRKEDSNLLSSDIFSFLLNSKVVFRILIL